MYRCAVTAGLPCFHSPESQFVGIVDEDSIFPRSSWFVPTDANVADRSLLNCNAYRGTGYFRTSIIVNGVTGAGSSLHRC